MTASGNDGRGEMFRLSVLGRQMRPSPIREMFRVIQRPGMISLAGGLPDPAVFPVEAFAECSEVLRSTGATLLQYGASEGYGPLVEAITERMATLHGRAPGSDEIIVTTGSQQAADLVGRVLLDPGDVVVVEAPTYPGAVHTFRNLGARFALVPCDRDGMCVEALPDVVEQCQRATGRLPKLLYAIPSFSNPAGTCLTTARRRRLVELAHELGLPIFEDDPYGEVRYDGEGVPSLWSLAEGEGVVYAGSFSKVLAPGTRVGWAVADPQVVRALVVARQGVDLCPSMVSQGLVAEYCRRGLLTQHLTVILDQYRRKRNVMAQALAEHLGSDDVGWAVPEGGFFFWLELTTGASLELFDRALEAGVAFLPGPSFVPAAEETVGSLVDAERFLRLCFTFAGADEIREGCRRLAVAISS